MKLKSVTLYYQKQKHDGPIVGKPLVESSSTYPLISLYTQQGWHTSKST